MDRLGPAGLYAAAQMQGQFAVLVPSCDEFSDVWSPFFTLFWRFWPDCPFPVYFLTNEQTLEVPRVTNISVGRDVSWSDNLRRGLGKIKESYVLLLLDDLFLLDFVKTERVLRVFRWILECEPNYVRLHPSQKPDRPYSDLVGLVSPGAIYRASTVGAVWRRQTLLELLREGESAWDFEIYGSIRSDSYDKFFSTWDNHLPFLNGVIKGKWHPRAVAALESAGVQVDLQNRKLMSRRETAVLGLAEWRSRLLNLLPAQYRRGVKDAILGGRYRYNPDASQLK